MDASLNKELQKLALEIRIGIVEEIQARGFGHIGGSLSLADALAVLYGAVMRYDSQNPKWPDRDKLVCSKGHAGPGVYATLAVKGFFPYEDLKTLNQPGTYLPSHCDKNKTPGVDACTGSLGQGASIAVGMAMAAKHGGKRYQVYTMVGDGECQEGQIWEAAMAAAHYKLDNLTVILDHNGLQIDGRNDDVMSLGNICAKFAAFGFDTVTVNGHDIDAVTAALRLPHTTGKPKFICCETVKGKGVSFMENNPGWHGTTIKTADYEAAMKELEAALNG